MISSSGVNRFRYVIPFQAAWRDWREKDAPVVGYVFKVWLAAVLALWISLRFDLAQPRTAMMTVVIVMQSARSGMVFAKSFYRFVGTLVGILMSLVLVALFAQDRLLFLFFTALWIGFCTAGSMVFRNHQSYGFVLAGYTLCIVGLPATQSPELTFTIAMTRISEILIGLSCATLVSDLVFSQRLWVVIQESVRRRFRDFSDLLRLVARPADDAVDLLPGLSRFASDIFTLESFRSAAVLENDQSRTQRLRLSLLNGEFMTVSTTFHALHQLMERQRRAGHERVRERLFTLYQPLGEVFTVQGRSAATEVEAQAVAQGVRQYRERFQRLATQAATGLTGTLSREEELDFETGVDLIERFADELQAYANTYVAMGSGHHPLREALTLDTPLDLTLRFDRLAVVLAGLRGTLTLALLATLWILTDWPSGIEAIVLGVVTSTLFATAPSPTHTIRQFVSGALIAGVMLYVVNFIWLERAQNWVTLVLILTPLILFFSWLSTFARIAVLGGSTLIVFFSHVGFGPSYAANPETYINESIADVLAILTSGVMYSLIDLSNSGWMRRRTATALRSLVVDACRNPLVPHRSTLENAARDLVQRMGSAQRLADEGDREVAQWLLSTLETGHAVIALRQQMAALAGEEPLLHLCLLRMADLYESPVGLRRAEALKALDVALEALYQPALRARLTLTQARALRTTVHFLRGVVLDEVSVLATLAPLEEPAAPAAAAGGAQ